MKTTHSDERDLNESLIRHAGPALVWAALLAFFAVAGAVSPDAPKQMANLGAVQLIADDDVPLLVITQLSARDSAQGDTVVDLEKLDPVGVGLNAAR